MQIGNIEHLSLENLSPDKLREAQAPRAAKEAASQSAGPGQAAATPAEGLGLDLSGMDEVHSLDPERVASLIADPFGDD